MQQVEEFMAQLFRTRIEEEKRILANRAPYRQRFFTPDCRWDNRAFTLEMIETERIISIDASDSEAAVITEFKASVSPPSARINRRRYHLEARGDSWLISRVEAQCPHCHGQGDESLFWLQGKALAMSRPTLYLANEAASVDAPTGVCLRLLRQGRRATEQRCWTAT